MCRSENYEPSFTEDFKKAVSDPYFVDKTMFLKEYIDSDFYCEATLMLRPRGFGKTLTLSMVKTFFEKTNEKTSVYFKDLAIWSCGKKYRSEQGKYPVICVDLTDLACDTFEEMEERFAEKMSAEFLRHTELAKKGVLDEDWLDEYEDVVEKRTKHGLISGTVELLTQLLYKCDKVKPMILVDGFEVPLIAGLKHGFYKDAFSFFEHMYSTSMKDNREGGSGLIFGEFYTVLANEFSGFNNVLTYSLTSFDYPDGFGFTKEEVRGLLTRLGKEKKFAEVRKWYGGYFAETREGKFVELFNPDSVIRYLKNGCSAKPYRDEVYVSEALEGSFASDRDYDKDILKKFLRGESESCYINDSSDFTEIEKHRVYYYQLLFMSGYLTRVKKIYRGYHSDCYEVMIPNREIMEIFKKYAVAHGYEVSETQE